MLYNSIIESHINKQLIKISESYTESVKLLVKNSTQNKIEMFNTNTDIIKDKHILVDTDILLDI